VAAVLATPGAALAPGGFPGTFFVPAAADGDDDGGNDAADE
jgi:hypothetical protein